MPLVTMGNVLRNAMKGKYAVGAFNADNLEMIQAFVRAAEDERAPVILQISQSAISYAGMETAAALARFEGTRAVVPVVVHLDHGMNYVQNVQALKAGVICLGIDAAMLPYEENLAKSKAVCALAHAAGLEAEAGLGFVPDSKENPSAEEVEANKTHPGQLEEFVAVTGVDLVPVALGSMRGMRQRTIDLDLDLLAELRHRVSVPFVLHGASGIRLESIQEAIGFGVCKVNMAACFDKRFTETLRKELAAHPNEIHFRPLTAAAREAVRAEARQQIRLLGGSNQV
ncbi:MAG: class II fructose-bisphosphate aldolase [Anaerolineales bacterium]|nr:class II fructose-bisphosphate aldolase [Anaerolineales bacterium]